MPGAKDIDAEAHPPAPETLSFPLNRAYRKILYDMLRRNGLGPRKAGIQPRGLDVLCECSPVIQIDLSEKVRYQFLFPQLVKKLTKIEQSLEQTIK